MDSDSSSSSSRKDFLRKFVGVITTVGLVESRTQSVSALEYEGASSSLNLAAEIKTLDFSLPSYDDLSDAKASVENVEGLAVEPLKENTPPDVVTKSKNKTKQPKEAKKKSSGGGGPDLSGILPSVGKQSAEDRKKAQTERAAIKAAAAAAAKEEREQKAAAASVDNIKTVDMSLPSYSDSTFAKDKSVFSL
eukprot:CAMPEP_0202458572 /NCGR_PEP_ID=MMETSP1360-20130828/26462_1 /ASSEMBLY_ACC=CAM_ASM_000848 /TAXON_ID=515479 /ORGANISM="Licmophora paradoxa, Strain CCMP2313" /LENGTH=191 /DNA_ID=CAMNT_0049079177 /DNA_START=202 /DNA_END=777 /DNA_ORIENTATION=+